MASGVDARQRRAQRRRGADRVGGADRDGEGCRGNRRRGTEDAGTGEAAVTLDELNRMDERAFVAALGGIYEHSPWVAAGAAVRRPFASIDALATSMAAVVADAGEARQLALIRAHPELAGKAMVRRELTAESTGEQSHAGLTDCSPAEFARLTNL